MRRLVIAAIALSGLVPSVAAADHPFGNVPWPNLLPPRAGVQAPSDPAAPCGDGVPSCVDGVIEDMIVGWEPLDAACDHRAVFSLTYLITTQGFREYLSDRRGDAFFDDEPWIIQLDRAFADLYFTAFDDYASGTSPPAWKAAFDAAGSGRTTATQDLFLGMNAHIQRDLPVALDAVGLVDASGTSHKSDHDRVNEILAAVIDPIQDELAARYDPTLETFDASPSPAEEVASLEMLKGWREGAWRNAERLALADDEKERAAVMSQIETYSTAWAEIIRATDFSAFRAMRDDYCRSRNASRPPGRTRNA